jgi:Predicted S-adenosylmethionine-dependent methyltransferase involved in cell envelope biogenesis
MKLPHTSLEEKHLPVMLNEVIKICSPQSSGVYLDCTFGAGGYSKAILKFKGTKVVALDRDHRVKKIADKLKEKFQSRFSFHTKRFSDLDKISTKIN